MNNIFSELIMYSEWVMLILVIGGGFGLMLYSRFLPFRKFGYAIKLLRKNENNSEKGEVSSFQALSSSVAATVGMGNISGVAIAIYYGGPGVVFWMWLTAILGMVIKFYSCSLAVMYRKKDKDLGILGGPMYYITEGIGPKAKVMAIVFCLAGLWGILPIFTVNQLTDTWMNVIEPHKWDTGLSIDNWRLTIGIGLAIVTSFIIFGGLQKIVATASKVVPPMVLLYFISTIIILVINHENIISSLGTIFYEAFNLKTSFTGGFWGLVLLGVRRAVFSNESGVGNAPMFHGQSKTKEPIHEGLVAMLGPFIDTIIVCTLTALVIIVTGVYKSGDSNGIVLTLKAFSTSFPQFGDILLMVIVSTFAISTLFTYSYYGTKCLGFLTNSKIGWYYNFIYIFSIIFAAITTVDMVTNIIDLSFAIMVVPNILAILYLAPKVNERIRVLFKS